MKKSEGEAIGRDAREKYWNEDYFRYWKARVEEANSSGARTSSLVAGDAKTGADAVYVDAIGLLKIAASDTVLELGCGFGRSLPLLCGAARRVAAVDISREMIAAARESCAATNVEFHVSPGESLPFADGTFDAIVCFAAFDAMYQAEALAEMNRVGRLGARVLLTGKNDDYFDDDRAALEAEAGARRKGHPNYFTDVRELLHRLERFGFRAGAQRFYPRRGDFSAGAFATAPPEKFYEYLLVLEKAGPAGAAGDLPISGSVSKTYARGRRE